MVTLAAARRRCIPQQEERHKGQDVHNKQSVMTIITVSTGDQ